MKWMPDSLPPYAMVGVSLQQLAPRQPASADLADWKANDETANTPARGQRSALETASAEREKRRLVARPPIHLVTSYGNKKNLLGGQSAQASPAINHNGSKGLQMIVRLHAVSGPNPPQLEGAGDSSKVERELDPTWWDIRPKVQNGKQVVTASIGDSSSRSAPLAISQGHDDGTHDALTVLGAQQHLAVQLEIRRQERERAVSAPYRAAIDFFRLDAERRTNHSVSPRNFLLQTFGSPSLRSTSK